ncbi:hypothetical protein ABBQ32_005033 [Trebouxia sp. C0010 RCD-2024]
MQSTQEIYTCQLTASCYEVMAYEVNATTNVPQSIGLPECCVAFLYGSRRPTKPAAYVRPVGQTQHPKFELRKVHRDACATCWLSVRCGFSFSVAQAHAICKCCVDTGLKPVTLGCVRTPT